MKKDHTYLWLLYNSAVASFARAANEREKDPDNLALRDAHEHWAREVVHCRQTIEAAVRGERDG